MKHKNKTSLTKLERFFAGRNKNSLTQLWNFFTGRNKNIFLVELISFFARGNKNFGFFSKFYCFLIIILLSGIIFRLYITREGHFLFNMDNARDMVEVREMVILKHPRLIGPNTAIEGFFTGPMWYYLLAIPFILSNGDPYALIVTEIILWAIGGFFLLKLLKPFGTLAYISVGLIWIASNYILLLTAYSYNPNPIGLLTPLFVYLLLKFLEKPKLIYSALLWFLAGAFFNFEMNAGVFMPLIIIGSVLFTNIRLITKKSLWLGSLFLFFVFYRRFCLILDISFSCPNLLLSFFKRVKNNRIIPYNVSTILMTDFMRC
jgi:hypothetical protein